MEKVPFSAVVALDSAPVALFLTVTSAPGITPPDLSTIVPESEELDPPPCPYRKVALNATRRNRKRDLKKKFLIMVPQSEMVTLTLGKGHPPFSFTTMAG
jgi:hypothetical protein